MGDKDERLSRSGSQSRFNPADLTGKSSNNNQISKLLAAYEKSQDLSDREIVELLRKVEIEGPAELGKAPKFVSKLINHKNERIRKLAYSCALTILKNSQNPRDIILDAYRLAMCSSNCLIAQHGISMLPNFVDVCPEEANNLLKFGSVAYNRLPAPDTETEMQLSRALTKASQ